ncbi:terminase small subunit [Clostridium perfringens]|uniref:terminase small subunit n=1 Tax=Clostridium perfringens TaxID=1502 RepID=UPI000F521D74|nr:terminase small subunit [Clostridium perfringens]
MAKVINDTIKIKLNDKQKRFCIEYLKELNGTKSYMEVYPDSSYDAARSSASDLLSNPNVKEYINRLLDEYCDNIDITIGEIVSGLKSIVTDKTARNSDKIKAMELLGKYKQMFVEKKEVTITSESNLENLSDEELEKKLKELE